jgi:hypothetical protein
MNGPKDWTLNMDLLNIFFLQGPGSAVYYASQGAKRNEALSD